MIRVGLIGNGTLAGRTIQHLTASGLAEITGVLVRSLGSPSNGRPLVDSIGALLACEPDVVIECAGQAALRTYAQTVLAAGVHLVASSVGALVDEGLLAGVLRVAVQSGAEIRLPSGAMVGIDGLAAARHGGIDSVLYRGTMAPMALKDYDGSAVNSKVLAFSGTAREAVTRFPKNVNLTATIALAGIGFERTKVELYVDPAVEANVHELHVTGDFGDFRVSVNGSRIASDSPTSRLVAGSLAQAAFGSNYTLVSAKPAAITLRR